MKLKAKNVGDFFVYIKLKMVVYLHHILNEKIQV